MIENVSLLKTKQKTFNKSVKKTQTEIKKGKIKISDRTVRRRKPITRKAIVYLSNIPHGFYEKEITGYFTQFGNIVKTRVARSKQTGNSKGHAFIMFEREDVAKIAAETMNNYLMGKRLLKAKVLPYAEKFRGIFRKPNFSKEHYPTLVRQQRFKKSYNAPITTEKQDEKTKKAIKHIEKIKNKLKECGIDYEFTLHIPSPIKVNEPKTDDLKEEKKTVKKIKIKKEILDVEGSKKQKKIKKEPKQTEKVKIKKESENINDSVSDDVIFTHPEKLARMAKRAQNEIKNRKKRRSSGKEKNSKKMKTSTDNINEEKGITKKRNKENKTEPNKNVNLAPKENKTKRKTVAKKTQEINKIKQIENPKKDKSPSPKMNKRTTEKNKKLTFSDITATNYSSPNIIEKKIKKTPADKSVQKKTLGVTKKSKKTGKISEKKASLMKELIKENDQVKSVKKTRKIK